MLLTLLWIVGLALLAAAGSVASYLRLLMRRLTPVSERRIFQPIEGRRIQADRERVGVSLSTLHGTTMALFTIGLTGLVVFRNPEHIWPDLGVSLLVTLCVIAISDQFIPFVLVARPYEPEVILERWLPFLRTTVFLALPLIFPILISTTISRLLEPVEAKLEAVSSQEDLQELIQVGEQEGLIEKGEGEMLQSVVEFGDKMVREMMTPRPQVAAIEINSPVEELRSLFRENRHSRYPVYSGQLDNILGIVGVQDLIELPPEEQSKVTLRSLLRPVPFVPETKQSKELLKEFQQSITQVAIVIDEYGSVAGLVSIEDLLEEIVGDIRDEVELHDGDIAKESSDTYLVAGHTGLAQVEDQLHVPIPAGDYSTVAGLILAHLGHVPLPGEKVEEIGLTFEVLEADPRTVLKVRLTLQHNDEEQGTRSKNNSRSKVRSEGEQLHGG